MTDFADFWAEYPRKKGRAKAMEAYPKALKGQLRQQLASGLGPATHEEIMAGLARYKLDKPDWCDWLHGSTFLNTVAWIDEGGSEIIEPERDNTKVLESQREDHEHGRYMWPSLAEKYSWAEFGSAESRAPKLKVVE